MRIVLVAVFAGFGLLAAGVAVSASSLAANVVNSLSLLPVAQPGENEQAIASTDPIAFTDPIASTDPTEVAAYRSYRDVIERTISMVSDPRARELARRSGLDILNITWEDTGRYYNSAVGPNISDMTIQVQQQDPATRQYQLSLMPVIRYPNFSDKTADVPLDQFFLLVGNERGEALQRVSLREFLGNMRRYLSQPDSWRGRHTSLLADRDTHALVSAQACFLPVASGRTAEFNPVLFNYQSYQGDPAVLTILATREGTSVTVIDNQRDGFAAGPTWGQRLFFNQSGDRASLTGQRLSDFVGSGQHDANQPSTSAAGESGLNMVLLIQVPLKQKQPIRTIQMGGSGTITSLPMAAAEQANSDVEEAVIGHGEVEGPFTEIAGLEIERDPQFPIRVTVQFYKATSNGVVSEQDMNQIQQQIARVYEDADYVGSLVVDGPSNRPTEYDGFHTEPTTWWNNFWQRYEENSGRSRQQAIELLRRLRGN